MKGPFPVRARAAALVSALALAAIWGAIPLLRFGLAAITLDEAASAARMSALVDDAVVGGMARARLIDNAGPSESRRRVAELSEMLARAPLSSGLWLDLARARFADGAEPAKIFSALDMSQMTGPNEALVMAGRAIFGLPLWMLASHEMREAITRDLVGGWFEVKDTRRMLLRVLLAQARPETRAELRAALIAHGKDGVAIAVRLGLAE
jgi:hypothetical protein